MLTYRSSCGIAGVLITFALATAACGSSRDSAFDDDGDSPGSFIGDDDEPGAFGSKDGGAGTPQAIGEDQKECASSFSEGNVMPVSLVFMYDKSSSMLQPTGTGASKWDAAKQGVGSFTSDPGSAGLFASIQFFDGDPIGPQPGTRCLASSYSTIAAGPVALPDNSVIAGAIASKTPSGSTATYYAYQGAQTIANTLLANDSGKRVAIVFVTDGIPEGCSYDNSVESTAVLAQQQYAKGVPTFVIGIGKTLTTINTIASAGGTTKAHIIDTNGDVTASLLTALIDVRGKVASCSLEIPAAPAGKKLDYNAVNVGYGGDTLSYSKDCAGGGWHYDNVTNPKTIELCPSTCEDVKKKANAKVTFALGCATKGGVH